MAVTPNEFTDQIMVYSGHIHRNIAFGLWWRHRPGRAGPGRGKARSRSAHQASTKAQGFLKPSLRYETLIHPRFSAAATAAAGPSPGIPPPPPASCFYTSTPLAPPNRPVSPTRFTLRQRCLRSRAPLRPTAVVGIGVFSNSPTPPSPPSRHGLRSRLRLELAGTTLPSSLRRRRRVLELLPASSKHRSSLPVFYFAFVSRHGAAFVSSLSAQLRQLSIVALRADATATDSRGN
ncbi:hypothetical protein GUJ93_ZPchr0007g4383 [Zizania palustris]|uniref:Uncharacterized protein n=1 Tax=Zizania palustris TaxID=103762 RepID=A0A8J5VPA6_ZIZPA|nr:hypothetical protein GUJ93_ZPchr0007g4383 [Zizania palustris]